MIEAIKELDQILLKRFNIKNVNAWLLIHGNLFVIELRTGEQKDYRSTNNPSEMLIYVDHSNLLLLLSLCPCL